MRDALGRQDGRAYTIRKSGSRDPPPASALAPAPTPRTTAACRRNPAGRYNEPHMARTVPSLRAPSTASRLGAFVAEQHPTLVRPVLEVFEAAAAPS